MVTQKEKFNDFKRFWKLLRDSLLVKESSATSPQSFVMSSTGSLYSTDSSYKITILARNCIHGISSAYFGDICALVTAALGLTNLRSATCGDLLLPQTQTKLGKRNFCIYAPTVWNSLPYSLKHSATSRENFQKELKTCMFRKAYTTASEKSELKYLLISIGSWLKICVEFFLGSVVMMQEINVCGFGVLVLACCFLLSGMYYINFLMIWIFPEVVTKTAEFIAFIRPIRLKCYILFGQLWNSEKCH